MIDLITHGPLDRNTAYSAGRISQYSIYLLKFECNAHESEISTFLHASIMCVYDLKALLSKYLEKGKGSPILGFERWARCLSPVLGHQPLGGIAITSAAGCQVFPLNPRLPSQ